MQDFYNAFQFVSDHIHMAGWVSLIILGIKLSWKVSAFISKITEAGETIDKVASNHLPHIQAGIENLGEETKGLRDDIKGLRQDLLTVALRKNDNLTISVHKNDDVR